MHCQNCGVLNTSSRHFCQQCGVVLPVACQVCALPNAVDANFCLGCGSRLPSAIEERRRVTLLFADIKGSTEMIQGHGGDPEHVKQLLAPVIAIMKAAAERYGGQVDRIPLGDAILAVFGAPQALEDHAVRACFAALSLQDGIKRWNQARHAAGRSAECHVRVGLNSGEILTTERQVDGPFGEATIIASRVETLAEPGQILMTKATWQIARGFVRARSLGSRMVKGRTEPLEVFELESMEARTRFHARQNQGLTPFVGRDLELDVLHRSYSHAADGAGQVVTLTGSPGTGKSRLLHHFLRYDVPVDATIIETTAEPYDREAVYLPIANLVRSKLSVAPIDSSSAICEKLQSRLTRREELHAGMVLLDVAPVDVLSVWGELDAVQKRRRIGDAVRSLIFDEAGRTVSVVLIEDLQWLDDDTRALVAEFTDDVRGRRVLLLLSTRERVRSAGAHHHVVPIEPLDVHESARVLSHLVGDVDAGDRLRTWMFQRADNQPTPLFIEETVSALIEHGALAGEPGRYRLHGDMETLARAIPQGLEAVLAARIDRLSRLHKDVLEAASVIGMESPVELLGAVSRVDVERLLSIVRDLELADLMYESLTYGQPEFRFKHTLTREVTATRIPKPRRRDLHGRTVAAIELLYAHRRSEWTDRLADHASRAGLWAEACRYYSEACKRASERSANRQAVTFAEKGLEALKALPASAETRQAEIDLRLLTLNALLPLGEQERIAEMLGTAKELALTVADPRRLAKVETQFALYLWEAGRHHDALRSGTTALELATLHALPQISRAARLQIGIVHHALGEFGRSLELHRQVMEELALGQLERRRVNWAAYPAVVARAFSADCRLSLGDFAEAAELIREGDLLTIELGDPYSHVLIDAVSGRYQLMQDEPQGAVDVLQRAEGLCHEYEIYTMLPAIVSALGTAYVRCGHVQLGLQRLQDALDRHTYRKAGNYTFYYLLMAIAEAEAAAGRPDVAAARAEHAEHLSRLNGERAHLAQALHLRASILAAQSPAAAEAIYMQARRCAEECAMRPLIADCWLGLARADRLHSPERSRERWDIARKLYLELGLGHRVQTVM